MNIKVIEKKHRMKTIIKNVEFLLNPGEVTLLIGSSGAGKSTLISCIMGTTNFKGNVSNKADKGYIAYVEQFPPLNNALSVEQSAYMSSLYHRSDMSNAQRNADVERCIRLLGLECVRKQEIATLSGGQYKRAALLSEIVGKPSMLILDECCSGLDYANQGKLFENAKYIAKSMNIPVLCSSHSYGWSENVFDKVVVMGKASDNVGHMIFEGDINSCKSFFGVKRLYDIIKLINNKNENGEAKTDYFLNKFRTMSDGSKLIEVKDQPASEVSNESAVRVRRRNFASENTAEHSRDIDMSSQRLAADIARIKADYKKDIRRVVESPTGYHQHDEKRKSSDSKEYLRNIAEYRREIQNKYQAQIKEEKRYECC